MERFVAQCNGDRMRELCVETAKIKFLIQKSIRRQFDLSREIFSGSCYCDFSGKRYGEAVAKQIFLNYLFSGTPSEFVINRFCGNGSKIFW